MKRKPQRATPATVPERGSAQGHGGAPAIEAQEITYRPPVCRHCGGAIPVEKGKTKPRMTRKYCSTECTGLSQRKVVTTRSCEGCKKQYVPRGDKSARKIERQRFCSRVCAGKHSIKRAQCKLTKWTPQEIAILRDAYAHNIPPSRITSLLPAFNRHAITAKAHQLGLPFKKLREWTPQEEEIVSAAVFKLGVTAAAFADAGKRIGRTPAAVLCRWKIIRAAGRPATHVPAASLAAILGVTPALVQEWIERAKILNAVKRPDGWHVAPKAVREMVRKDPDLIDLRRVNKRAFLNLLLDPRLA